MRGFLEFDVEVVAQVVAAPAARPRAAPPGAEEVAEDIGEDFLEALAEVEAPEAPRALRSLERGMTEAIILRALFRIRQDLVGLVEFLEVFLGLFVAGITVRMELNRQTPVGFLEFVIPGAPGNSQDFIIVAFLLSGHRAAILCEWHA